MNLNNRLFLKHPLKRFGIQDGNERRLVGDDSLRFHGMQFPMQRRAGDVHQSGPMGDGFRDADARGSVFSRLHQEIMRDFLGDAVIGKQFQALLQEIRGVGQLPREILAQSFFLWDE